MTFQGWYSQKDVIEDLMWATGKSVRNIDEHLLVGQEPPRPTEHNVNEDTEMQLMRLNGGCRPLNSQMTKPDLAGITKMLRMVDQLSDPRQEEPRVQAADKPSEQILSISKLNPEVREFVPKNNGTLDSVKESKPKTDSRDNNNKLSPNNRIDRTQLTAEELKDMREKLKSKIITSNTACVRVKRERNLAIATLLNLHCKAPKQSTDDVKPTLITPEYYERSIDKTNKENVDCNNTSNSVSECTENVSDERVAASVDKVQKWLSASEAKSVTEINNNDNDLNQRGKVERNAKKKSETPINDDNDLNERAKVKVEVENGHQKATTLYLGPVTFKRKAITKPNSSASSECERAKTLKSTVFVPSAYASELTKTYMERCKLKDSISNDLWKRVEMAIQAKESERKSTENTPLEQTGDPESETVA